MGLFTLEVRKKSLSQTHYLYNIYQFKWQYCINIMIGASYILRQGKKRQNDDGGYRSKKKEGVDIKEILSSSSCNNNRISLM